MDLFKKYKKEFQECKALKGKSVKDILISEKFQQNFTAYWNSQKADREAAIASAKAMGAKIRGFKVPAHAIDAFMKDSVGDMIVDYTMVLSGQSKRPARERVYLRQLGDQAYNKTIAEILIEEFPYLEDELMPKTPQAN